MRAMWLAGTGLVGLCAVPGAAWAQQTTTAPSAAIAAADAQSEQSGPTASTEGLTDIIVTAQRRSESAQRAAVAISVVSGGDLVRTGITNAVELSRAVPGLAINTVGGSNNSFIRGVGNFSATAASDATVAFNYDGVYLGRQQASSGTFFDLERVEVLKGPQGTLYGRNATAGVINVIPARPQIGQFSGYATASYGNYDALTAEGAVNIPIGANAALRLSGAVTNRDGYLSDGTNDSKTQAVRGQFLFRPTPALTIRVGADYTHLGGNGAGFTWLESQVLNVVTGVFTVTPANIPFSQGPGSPASQAFYTARRTGGLTVPVGLPPGLAGRNRDPFPDTFRNNRFYGINSEITWDTGHGTLTVLPAYRRDHIRNLNPGGGFPVSIDQHDHQFSLEARYAGRVGFLGYTVGGYYFDEHVNNRQGTSTFGTTTLFQSPQILTTRSWAGFARLVANFSSSARLVGGIRYTHDHRTNDATLIQVSETCNAGFTCPTAILPVAVVRPSDLPFTVPAAGTSIPGPTPNTTITRAPDFVLHNRISDGRVTWRGAFEYDVAPTSLLYASIETGYRSGGFNVSQGFETYQPEYITAYTAGSKNRFFNNRLQFNVEAFYWRYRNQQVAHPGVDVAFRAGSITENIGRSEISGVEVDSRFLLTPTTVLSADVAYLHTETKEFTYTVPSPLRPLTYCATTPNAARPGFFNINCAGLPNFNSPRWTINLAAQQTIHLGAYNLVLSADTQYKSRRFVAFDYSPREVQGASWTSGAEIAFGPVDNRWSVSAFVRNIENDRLLTAALLFGNLVVGYTTPPRTYGARAAYHF